MKFKGSKEFTDFIGTLSPLEFEIESGGLVTIVVKVASLKRYSANNQEAKYEIHLISPDKQLHESLGVASSKTELAKLLSIAEKSLKFYDKVVKPTEYKSEIVNVKT